MATISKELKPWRAPNFAALAGGEYSAGVPVSELPRSTLNEMAADWLDDLYRKAGKQSPWMNMG